MFWLENALSACLSAWISHANLRMIHKTLNPPCSVFRTMLHATLTFCVVHHTDQFWELFTFKCASRWMCIKMCHTVCVLFTVTCNIKRIKVCSWWTLHWFADGVCLCHRSTCTGRPFALVRDIKWHNVAATRVLHASLKGVEQTTPCDKSPTEVGVGLADEPLLMHVFSSNRHVHWQAVSVTFLPSKLGVRACMCARSVSVSVDSRAW